MKIAILIIGHIRRSFDYDKLHNFILEFKKNKAFTECDVYIFTWSTYEAGVGNKIKTEDGNEIDLLSSVKYDKQLQGLQLSDKTIIDYFKPIKLAAVNIYTQTEDLVKQQENITCGAKYMYWLNYEAAKYIANTKKYDAVLRMRPDVHKFIGFSQKILIKKYMKEILQLNYEKDILGLLYPLGGAIGDCFYCMSSDNFFLLQEYILHKMDRLYDKSQPIEWIIRKAVATFGFKKKCTEIDLVNTFYKMLFGLQWFRKN